MIVCLGDFFTCIFAGFVIFSYLGFMAGKQSTTVDKVAQDGTNLLSHRSALRFPLCLTFVYERIVVSKSNRNSMKRNWSNQKANPALKTKTGNK